MIQRQTYLDRLIGNMWNGEIKVITGIRRCGKSVLLFKLFVDYLKNNGVPANQIISFELDQRKYFKFRDPIILCEYVEKLVSANPEKEFYLLIDEVQYTTKKIDRESGIEVSIYDMLNELKSYKNLDTYVTGSNSKMLSTDVATEFRGRATRIPVYPLCFSEYFAAVGGTPQEALKQYMLYGGMPRIISLKSDEDKIRYLASLYEEVYIKDIVEHGKIEKKDILNHLLDYLASQIGSLTNPTNIANSLGHSLNVKINPALITSYIQNTKESFLIDIAKRFDVKGKTYFSFPNKYYYTDIGLRNARLSYRQFEPGHIVENIIYNELISRGYVVDVGVVEKRSSNKKELKEIDFVVNNGNRKCYIQSALRIENEEKARLETESLRLTKDFFKRIVIRTDIPHSFYDEEGIYNCNLIDFLLGKTEIF